MRKLGVLSISLIVVFSMFGVASAASFGLDFDRDFAKTLGIYPANFGNPIVEDNREFAHIQFDDSNLLGDDGALVLTLTAMNWFGNTPPRWKRPPWRKKPPLWKKPPWPGCPDPHHPTPVPEPTTMILLGMGLVGTAIPGRKKIFKKK